VVPPFSELDGTSGLLGACQGVDLSRSFGGWRTWSSTVTAAALLFGADRQVLSGSGGPGDRTRSGWKHLALNLSLATTFS
jgi:hypothetical protein